MLQTGPTAPSLDEAHQWVADALEQAERMKRQSDLDARHDAARKAIRKAAQSMQKAVSAVHALENRFNGEALENLLPLEAPERFEADCHALAQWGVQEIIFENPPPTTGRPKLPPVVLMLHQIAVSMLEAAGIAPATGTGASVAKLGALLCVAAGLHLEKGESTQAARQAVDYADPVSGAAALFRAHGIRYTNLDEDLKSLRKLEHGLNKAKSTLNGKIDD